MEPLNIFLLVLAVVAIAVSLWLLVERFRLITARNLAEGRLRDQEDAKRSFQAIADVALRTSSEQLVQLNQEQLAARQAEANAEIDKRREGIDRLIEPIQAAIKKTHEELKRVGQDHLGLREQVQVMNESNRKLRAETSKLAQAFGQPNVRGRYGEIQLQRVVELAGMRSYCDFTAQEVLHDEEGNLQKPDLVVHLPNDRLIAIDAKVSFDAYKKAIDADTPEEAEAALELYAENVLQQAQKLAHKKYWARFDASPEFVVMFIPGDQLVDAALERRPQLLEFAAQNNVVIASPSTLIGLLRAVAVGWREKKLSDSAEELFELGRELHHRAAVVLEKASKVGQSLDASRRHYNEFVGSVQSRLVPTLRKFEERDARSAKTLVEPKRIEGESRELLPLAPGDVEVEPKELLVTGEDETE